MTKPSTGEMAGVGCVDEDKGCSRLRSQYPFDIDRVNASCECCCIYGQREEAAWKVVGLGETYICTRMALFWDA